MAGVGEWYEMVDKEDGHFFFYRQVWWPVLKRGTNDHLQSRVLVEWEEWSSERPFNMESSCVIHPLSLQLKLVSGLAPTLRALVILLWGHIINSGSENPAANTQSYDSFLLNEPNTFLPIPCLVYVHTVDTLVLGLPWLRFMLSIIHGNGRAQKPGKVWEHLSREWRRVDARWTWGGETHIHVCNGVLIMELFKWPLHLIYKECNTLLNVWSRKWLV